MDLWTATWAEIAIAGLCLVTLTVAFVTAGRERTTRGAMTEADTKAIAKLRLLEMRVSELTSRVADLEGWRVSTGAEPDVFDRRAVLIGGRPVADTGVVRLPGAES